MRKLLILALALMTITACPVTSVQPKLTRIEITPISVLLTVVGQTHAFTAQGFDQNNQPFPTTVTWVSSNPSAVSVNNIGEVSALISLGSAQLRAKVGDLESPPVSVIVAEPTPGAVLVSDVQVLTGPEPLDPVHALELGAQSKLTLTGVSGLTPGTILLASEAKPIGGRIVSATDVGNGKLEVILEAVTLPEMLAHYSIQGQYAIQEEFSSSDNTKAAIPRFDDYPFSWGPLKCKLGGALTLGGASFTYTFKPDVSVETRFDESIAMVKITGTLTGTMKGTVRLVGQLTGTANCKLETMRKIIPLGGPIAAIIALQVPAGIRADLALTIKTPGAELGFENKTTTKVTAGFSCDMNFGLCANLSDADIKSETKPILNISNTITDFRIEGNAGLYGFIGLDVGSPIGQALGVSKPLSILEAFLGARQSFTFASKNTQAKDAAYASKYDLKIYGELGFGGDVKKALQKVFTTNITTPLAIVIEIPLDSSPFGQDKVDKTQVTVGEATKFTINLDSKSLNYVGIGYNVERILIYRKPPGKSDLEDAPIGSVSTSSGQSEFSWTWTPTGADIGSNEFYAFVETKPTSIPLEITENSKLSVIVTGDSFVTITIKGSRTENYAAPATGSEHSEVDFSWQFDQTDKAPIIQPPGVVFGQAIPGTGLYFLKPSLNGFVGHNGSFNLKQDCTCEAGTDEQSRNFDHSALDAKILGSLTNPSVNLQMQADGSYTGSVMFPQFSLSGNYSGSENVNVGCPSDVRQPVNQTITGNLEQAPLVASNFSGKIDLSKESLLQGSTPPLQAQVAIRYKSSGSAFDTSFTSWSVPVTVTVTWKLSFASPVKSSSRNLTPVFPNVLPTLPNPSQDTSDQLPWNGISPVAKIKREPRC
jgi:hypothetical protein